MGRVQYNKLIRDRIPEKIRSAGEECEVRAIADDAEFERELLRKVVEEAQELAHAEGRDEFLNEYADLMVVLDALTRLKEFSPADIKDALSRSMEKKGGFEERYFLNWSDDKNN